MKNSNGGYKQKANHWGMQNILGIGVGARSYLQNINYRSGYSASEGEKIYNFYVESIKKYRNCIVDGFILSKDESMRKHIILGLNKLSVENFLKKYGHTPMSIYPKEFEMLKQEDMIEMDGAFISLTQKGRKYRDIIAQNFFSKTINKLIESYEYNE